MPRPGVGRTKKATELVLTALTNFNNISGTSIGKISEYVSNEYDMKEGPFRRLITKAIDRGLAFGAIKKIRNKYAIGDVIHYIRDIKGDMSHIRARKLKTHSKRKNKHRRKTHRKV